MITVKLRHDNDPSNPLTKVTFEIPQSFMENIDRTTQAQVQAAFAGQTARDYAIGVLRLCEIEAARHEAARLREIAQQELQARGNCA